MDVQGCGPTQMEQATLSSFTPSHRTSCPQRPAQHPPVRLQLIHAAQPPEGQQGHGHSGAAHNQQPCVHREVAQARLGCKWHCPGAVAALWNHGPLASCPPTPSLG